MRNWAVKKGRWGGQLEQFLTRNIQRLTCECWPSCHTSPWIHKRQPSLTPRWVRPPEPEPELNPDWTRRRWEWRPSRWRGCGLAHSPGCDGRAAASAGRGGAGCPTDTPSCAPLWRDDNDNDEKCATPSKNDKKKAKTDLSKKAWSPFLLPSRKSSLLK